MQNQSGPYAPAIARFHISFPPTYPDLPPLLTFSTDMFHPLLTPLTTYTYTTSATETDTVSATDEERLPPGGFSLRHGFPSWFGRAAKGVVEPGAPSDSHRASGSGVAGVEQGAVIPFGETVWTPSPQEPHSISIYEILDYVKSAFSNEHLISSIPLDAAANPGAYHAWHTYRGKHSDVHRPQQSSEKSSRDSLGADATSSATAASGRTRKPGQWNWEGVWEERVRKGVSASISESVLFGTAANGEDMVRESVEPTFSIG